MYDVTLTDKITYCIEANTQEEAIDKALNLWQVRTPSIDTIEKKKVKRTVYYAVLNYYKQDVLVDADLDNDEIKDLWNSDDIETLNEPELAESYSEIDYGSIWVK